MGNMVNVTLLTDCWHQVKKDPERLIRAIDVGMIEAEQYPYGRETIQGVQVQRYHHASHVQAITNYGNLAVEMNRYNKHTEALAATEHGRDHLRMLIANVESQLDGLKEMLKEAEG